MWLIIQDFCINVMKYLDLSSFQFTSLDKNLYSDLVIKYINDF